MSEGTKLGAYKDDHEFKTAVRHKEEGEEGQLQGTKMGEVSAFERSLLGDVESKPSKAPVKEVLTSEASEEDSPSPVVGEQGVPSVSDSKTDMSSESEENVDSQSDVSQATNDPSNQDKEDDDGSALFKEAVSVEDSVSEGDSGDDLFTQAMDQAVADYQEGDIIKGIVRSVEKSGVLVDISFKSDGFISNGEFSNDPNESPADVINVGDEVTVYIMKLESKEGYTVLSRRRAEYEVAWNTISKFMKQRQAISVRVLSNVQGGLVSDYKGIKGFIPASHVVKEDGQDLDDFVQQTLDVMVLQSDRKRRKVVFSHKHAISKGPKRDISKLLEAIEVGQIKEGKVTSVKDFGAFIDVGGVEGLVHISELSWARVGHPSEIVKVGDDVKVFVLGIDKENNKISLGMKQLQEDPWVNVAEKYQVGQKITGTVSRITNFGAFFQIEDHLEGLIHISELAYRHVDKVEDVVNVGQVLQARIIKLVPDEQKIGLSLKGISSDSKDVSGNQEGAVPDSETSERDMMEASEPVSDSGDVVTSSETTDVVSETGSDDADLVSVESDNASDAEVPSETVEDGVDLHDTVADPDVEQPVIAADLEEAVTD